PAQAGYPRPGVDLALDQSGQPPEPRSVDTGALERLGDQRHRVERLRGLADLGRDVLSGDAAAEQLAGAPVAAAPRERGRGQVADPGEPDERIRVGAEAERVLGALAPDLGGRDPGGVEPVRLGRGGGEGGGVLRRARHLDTEDVGGALTDEPGAVEDL